LLLEVRYVDDRCYVAVTLHLPFTLLFTLHTCRYAARCSRSLRCGTLRLNRLRTRRAIYYPVLHLYVAGYICGDDVALPFYVATVCAFAYVCCRCSFRDLPRYTRVDLVVYRCHVVLYLYLPLYIVALPLFDRSRFTRCTLLRYVPRCVVRCGWSLRRFTVYLALRTVLRACLCVRSRLPHRWWDTFSRVTRVRTRCACHTARSGSVATAFTRVCSG